MVARAEISRLLQKKKSHRVAVAVAVDAVAVLVMGDFGLARVPLRTTMAHKETCKGVALVALALVVVVEVGVVIPFVLFRSSAGSPRSRRRPH